MLSQTSCTLTRSLSVCLSVHPSNPLEPVERSVMLLGPVHQPVSCVHSAASPCRRVGAWPGTTSRWAWWLSPHVVPPPPTPWCRGAGSRPGESSRRSQCGRKISPTTIYLALASLPKLCWAPKEVTSQLLPCWVQSCLWASLWRTWRSWGLPACHMFAGKS